MDEAYRQNLSSSVTPSLFPSISFFRPLNSACSGRLPLIFHHYHLSGNWSEEISLNKAKMDDFKTKTASGSSNLRKLQNKMSKCTTQVPLVYAGDGSLRFGDSVMFGNLQSSSVLVCDPFSDNIPGMGMFRVSCAAEANEPVARNTFTICRPPSKLKNFTDDEEDPVLRIGQAFCLRCNENLLANADSNFLEPLLYLASTKKTERTCTKNSNRQMVYMTSQQNADTIWTLMPPSRGKIGSSERYLSVGSPVRVSDPIMLIHRQTNTNLTVDTKQSAVTEFGVEYECYNDRASSFGKLGVIVSEFNGTSTGESLSKPDAINYYWSIITATEPSDDNGPVTNELPPPATKEILVEEVRKVSSLKGSQGFAALRLLFVILDMNTRVNDGKLDREDVKECLIRWGLGLDHRYLDILLSSHETQNSGLINYREYLDYLRGPLSDRRLEILQNTYSLLESVNATNVESFRSVFIAQRHPLVQDGVCSPDDLVKYFRESLSFREKIPTVITFIAFVDFFNDVCHGDDDSFERLMADLFSCGTSRK